MHQVREIAVAALWIEIAGKEVRLFRVVGDQIRILWRSAFAISKGLALCATVVRQHALSGIQSGDTVQFF